MNQEASTGLTFAMFGNLGYEDEEGGTWMAMAGADCTRNDQRGNRSVVSLCYAARMGKQGRMMRGR